MTNKTDENENEKEMEIQNPNRTPTPEPEFDFDPLPETKQALEIRINYHIAELDRLKKQIRTLNEHIRENSARAFYVTQRCAKEMPVSTRHLETLVDCSRSMRDMYGDWITYHRNELRRLLERKEVLDAECGMKIPAPVDTNGTGNGSAGTVAHVLKKYLENGREWKALFSV